jgi:hypothetical protein
MEEAMLLLDHQSSSMGEDGVFRVGYLHHLVMRYWLQLHDHRLVDLPQDLRSVYCFETAEETTDQAAVSGTVGGEADSQPQDEADTSNARPRLTPSEREELASDALNLVCLAAIAAGPLPFGGAVRVSCTLQMTDRAEGELLFAGLPDAEIFVTRLSLPHEPLRFAIAAYDGGRDPALWTFEFEGRTLRHWNNEV